ncbi:MAG: MerR family transcriptional regulator [Bacteroidota bacterium]
MTKYSVKQLSKLAGVSIRTLHHYDSIGLLKPADRSEKGYRFYGRDELLKLQQILFYRELDFPLSEIDEIVNNPDFDMIKALEYHREQLKVKSERFEKLLSTIDKTILSLKNSKTMMTDKEIYKGFSKEKVEDMRNEVKNLWGEDQLLAVEEKIRKLGKEGWEDAQKKGEEINRLLAELITLPPEHIKVQEAIVLHHRHLCTFYEVTKERYLSLGKMYTEDERFTAYYENYATGLAKFLYDAIKVFCNNEMKVVGS